MSGTFYYQTAIEEFFQKRVRIACSVDLILISARRKVLEFSLKGSKPIRHFAVRFQNDEYLAGIARLGKRVSAHYLRMAIDALAACLVRAAGLICCDTVALFGNMLLKLQSDVFAGAARIFRRVDMHHLAVFLGRGLLQHVTFGGSYLLTDNIEDIDILRGINTHQHAGRKGATALRCCVIPCAHAEE